MKTELVKTYEEVEKKKSWNAATVEEALTLTGFGKYNLSLLLVCGWCLQAMGMDLFGSSFVVAASVCDLELTMQQRGLLTAIPLVGVVAGAHLWGYVSDTKGRKLTLVLSMSIGFVFATLGAFSPDWRTMAVFKLISAIFTSASNSGAYTLLGESCPGRSRGRSMLLCTSLLMCSLAVVAMFAYPILPLNFAYWIDFLSINFRPWRLLAIVMAVPCAATACLLQFFHESPKFLASQGRYDEALKVLRSIYACNTGKCADDFPVKKLIEDEDFNHVHSSILQSIYHQTVPLFRPPLLKNTLKLFYLVAVIYMTGSGFILWLPYIMNNLFTVLETGGGEGMNLCTVIRYSAQKTLNATEDGTDIKICDDVIQDTTLLSAMTYGALACTSNMALSLACGSRKKRGMCGVLATATAAGVLLNVVHVPIAGGILFFFFLLCALSMGILSVYFVELYPTSLRGMMSCLSIMVGRSSAFLGVNAIGALISYDCETTFYVWSLLLFSTIVVTSFLPNDQREEEKTFNL